MAVSIAEPPPTATKPSHVAAIGERDRFEEGFVGRLDADAVEELEVDAGGFERLEDGLHRGQPRHRGIGDDERPPDAERLKIRADFTRHARAKPHG